MDGEDEDQEEEGEEEAPENDEEVQADEDKRDFGKARKFQKLLKAGQVPDDIKEMWDNPNSSRLMKTKLINSMFKKDSKGNYVFQPGQASVSHANELSDATFAKSQTIGVPKTIMIHHYFHGSKTAFEEALLEGDLMETEENGKYYYSFKQLKAGRKKKNNEPTKLDGGSASLETAEYAEMASFLKNRPWSKFGISSGPSSSSGLPKKKEQLALEDEKKDVAPKATKVKWDTLEEVLQDAKASQERLLREGQKLVGKVKASDDAVLADDLKGIMTTLSESHKKLQEALRWQSLGDTNLEKVKVENWLHDLATTTEGANEKLERLKATLKARGYWKAFCLQWLLETNAWSF